MQTISMEWTQILITIGVLIVGIALAWGKFGTRIALIEQSVKEIKNNHLSHIEADMREAKNAIKKIEGSLIRLESSLEFKLKN